MIKIRIVITKFMMYQLKKNMLNNHNHYQLMKYLFGEKITHIYYQYFYLFM